jgi:hypothetical protein
MNVKPRTPEETYEPALQKAQLAFAKLNPHQAADCAGVTYHSYTSQEGEFQVSFFGGDHHVLWPAGTIREADPHKKTDTTTRILLLHYLVTADGTPLSDRWIAFRNLPGGLGYDAAFEGRANRRLAHTFGSDRTAFESAARALGGEQLSFGNASFAFRILPRVWLAVVLYLADEEFPASANVLFDAAASHYLATEDLAVLGGILAGRLSKAAQSR